MADRFVFDAELLLHSNGEQFVREIRTIFTQLRAEAERLIKTGSQSAIAGLPAQYTSVLGQSAAIIQGKPLSDRQRELAQKSLASTEQYYGSFLQGFAGSKGLELKSLSPTALSQSYQSGSKLLQQALTEQSNALLRGREAADELSAAERRAARQQELAAGRAALGAPGGRGARTVADETAALETRAQTARDQAASKEWREAKARATLAERQRTIAVAKATHDEALSQGQGEGTLFQRLQYAIHARSGLTDTRLPQDFQSFGQFFTSKALTTGGFALSGAVLYGAVSGFREITREASALQRELAVVKSQFDELGDSRGFQEFSKEVVDISVNTGVAADQIALVARQLAGVFRDENTGLPDFKKSLSETQQAIKLSQVTGLPFQEITDSLTAITVTFGTSFTKIGDLAIGLEKRFGVLAPQLIEFTADVAPVAKELGFTVDQITALGAIAQQRSGVSGSGLAENFNRALPAIQQTQIALSQLLAQRPETQGFIQPILTALSSAKGADALAGLTRAYGVMNQAQRQALGDLLGGERNAKAFFAVLQGGQDTIDALEGKTGDFTGSLDARFKDFQSTVEFAFEKARRALEQFGLALFNSGLADGLKLIADSGALVAKFAGDLLKLFSQFNDVLGGLPVKLLAVYAALRLIMALGGGIGGFRNLFANIAARGAVAETAAAAGPQFASPYNAAAFAAPAGGGAAAQAFRFGIPLGSLGTGAAASAAAPVAGAVAALGPAIVATGLAAVVQTVQGIQQQVDDSRKSLQDDVRDKLTKGVSPATILSYVKSNYSDKSFGVTLAGRNLPGSVSRDDAAIDTIQKANAERQGKELSAIIKGVNEQQAQKLLDAIGRSQPTANEQLVGGPDLNGDAKTRLQALIDSFTDDPTHQATNDDIARVIALAASGGAPPETIAQLQSIAKDYAAKLDAAAQLQNATDYAPVLAEVKANYDAGTANLEDLVAVERKNIDILTGDLRTVTGDARVQAAQQLAEAQRQLDSDLSNAANRASDLLIKIGAAKGGNVADLTFLGKMQALNSLIAGGASPTARLDASLNVLDAQTKQLDQFINSPVIVNGIARAPTAAEKLARAARGTEISPQLREAIVRAALLINKGGDVAGIAKVSGIDTEKIIDSVVAIVRDADHTIFDVLISQIDSREANLKRELVNLEPDDDALRAGVSAKLAALDAARTALENLPSGATDPGTKLTEDTTDLQNQAAIEATQEADALAQALAAKERAEAHGDPVLVAQASVRAAQTALARAQAGGKQSEIVNAQAQLIDAQNNLEDANNAVIAAYIGFAAATTHDPVKKALFELDAANRAVADAHGAAAELQALAQQVAAQESVGDALTAVFAAQHNLLAAIDTAAGDTIGAAKEQLNVAKQNLDHLVARDQARGDNPDGDPDVINAKAAVVSAQANVRDTALRKQESDIDIALQLERITTGQAIAQLQALLQIPNITTEQTNEILLKIKQLQNDLSRDLQFNLPSEIKVPTAYEVRRIAGETGTGTGISGGYQDNRQINVIVYAKTGASPKEIGQATAAAIGPTRVNGAFPRRYGG